MQFNPYCLFRIFWANFLYDLSAHQHLIFSKSDICGITSSRKTWSFLRKNLLDLIALDFFIFLIIFDQKTRMLSFTGFLIILKKNGFTMMCFLSNKVLLSKDNTVWSILRLKVRLICVVFFWYCKEFWWKSRRV